MSNNRELGYVVGAVAGYFTGGFSYVALGATAGGIIGGLLDPKTQTQGPRLDDLKVQFSAYGVGVPRLYGTYRISPNVIWSTDKIELSTTTSQGKGGGGTENTSYSYFVQMRQLYVETPRDGNDVAIVKTFKNGAIIYDASSGASLASSLASAENPFAFFTLYQGKPDQLPDSVEELYQGGPGTVPAYRGVVSNSLKAIECPGGRVPQFSQVLSSNATLEDVLYLGETTSIPTPVKTSISRMSSDGATSTFFAEYSVESSTPFPQKQVKVYAFGLDGATQIDQWGLGSQFWGAYTALPGIADIDALCVRQVSAIDTVDSGLNVVFDSAGRTLKVFDLGPEFLAFGQTGSRWSKSGDYFAISGDNGTPTLIGLYRWESAGLVDIVEVPYHQNIIVASDCLWVFFDDGGITRSLLALSLEDMSVIASVPLPAVLANANYELKFTTIEGVRLAIWAGDPVGVDSYVYEATLDVGTIVFTEVQHAHRLEADLPFPIQDAIGIKPGVVYGWERLNVDEDTDIRAFMLAFDRVTPNAKKVSEIIAEECERAGETRYDLSAIPDTDTVIGYVIANPASARANIDPLLTAFQIFIVDEDGTIKFKKYEDIVSVADISFDELGQAEDGAEPSDAMPLVRTQTIDLPRSVSVSYIEPTYDYQTATETEVRQVTESTEDMLISLPMAITSNQARKAAANVLFSLHRRQNTRSLKVSRKFAFLSPGDGTMIEYPRGTWKLWRWINITDTGALIEGTVEPGDAELYSQVGIGATGYVSQEVPPLAPQSLLSLFDMPILRDEDSSAGKYVAIKPYALTGWRGTSVLVSDDDVTFVDKGTVTRPAVLGFAETVLEDGPFGEIDHSNQVIVNVGAGELNSTSWESLFANTENLAALKTSFESAGFPDAVVEIFQFRVATDLGGGRYLLSELVRGLYGTERVAFNHQAGDKFLLLSDNGILRVNLETGAIGSTKYFKPVSLGRSLAGVTSIADETVGYGLKPLSPINVKLDRSPADGSIVFTWGRRTRLSHNAMRSNMPLGEAGEAFEVVIYTAPDYQVIERVYRVYAPTFTYLAVDLASDGYTQSGAIPYRIYQISDAIGRGVPFQPGQGIQ